MGRAKVVAFGLDRFIGDCCAALSADPPHKAVRELVARAVSMPTAVLGGLGEPRRAEVQKLYHSDRLTILNVIWAPRMTILQHNHAMWAVIGIIPAGRTPSSGAASPTRRMAGSKPRARRRSQREMWCRSDATSFTR